MGQRPGQGTLSNVTADPREPDASAWEPDEEDIAFFRVYGPWEPLTPRQMRELMDGFPHPWWLVGGHSIEAFTGVRRHHEDLDLSLFVDAVPDLGKQLGERFHLWSNDGGTLRIIDEKRPEPLHPLAQIWVREHALAPWLVDIVPSPAVDGRWQSKRDEDHVADLDEVTWVHADGVRYQNPEISLLFKASQNRPKDRIDLASTWPLLAPEKKQWLRQAVARLYPENPWNRALASDDAISWPEEA